MNIFNMHGLNAVQAGLNLTQEQLVNITAILNEGVGKTAVDKFMDEAVGRGHRIVHGHSPEFLIQIVNKYGIEAVPDAFIHWMKDFMSKDGVPILPYTDQIASALGISKVQAINWLCVNIGDVVSGGFSAYQSYHLAQVVLQSVHSGYLPKSVFIDALLSSSIKVGTSLVHPNPISMAAGIIDMGFVLYALSNGVKLGAPVVPVGGGEFANAAFWSGSFAAGAAYIGSKMNKEKFNFNREFVAGAVGGVCGYSFSLAVSANPVGVSAAAIGGFVLARETYKYLEQIGESDEEFFVPYPSFV